MGQWFVGLYTSIGYKRLGSVQLFAEEHVCYSEKNIAVTYEQTKKGQDALIAITVLGEGECYVGIEYEGDGEVSTFSGTVTYERYIRQSPRDISDYTLDMEKEAVPMAAVLENGIYTAAISDQPGHCDNATTQHVFPDSFQICSGDCGIIRGKGKKTFAPVYHKVTEGKNHEFRLMLCRFKADTLNQFRNQIFRGIDRVWGEGGSAFHSVCFAGNYMHYRKNETGYSDYWVVPGIEYANYQYPRDAFWQSMILPKEMADQCYMAINPGRYSYAENGLFYLIWSYRNLKNGGGLNEESVKGALQYVSQFCRDGCYCTNKGDETEYEFKIQSWYDICAFEWDDVITYNQGLLAVAMRAAEEMGLTPPVKWQDAAEEYKKQFNGTYFPLSRKKQCLSLDVFIGDILFFLLFDECVLSDDVVQKCYQYVIEHNNTPYGRKVVCGEQGEFLPMEFHGAYGYICPHQKELQPGEYAYGSSYYLYEMLFHIGAYLHHAEGAEEHLISRGKLDFNIGGTFYEHINTVTGLGNKANQGWNCAIYSIWEQLMKRGIADDRFFREIEKVLG
ncbi:MAG: hypothetical protein E7399_06445 [Ruminococcaceae bacterium]|nr:hypothetical protein [Oscillospiraceae bacterium]